MKKTFAGVALALAIVTPSLAADKTATPKYRFDAVAHLSCKEMWQESGQSVDRAFAIIETMTTYLLRKREQGFPQTREAGQGFGKAIDTHCRSNPDQLLLAAVDVALRETLAR